MSVQNIILKSAYCYYFLFEVIKKVMLKTCKSSKSTNILGQE